MAITDVAAWRDTLKNQGREIIESAFVCLLDEYLPRNGQRVI